MRKLLLALLLLTVTFTTAAKSAITEQEAHAIGVDAYLYFYPLVLMDITRKQSTNIEPGKEFGRGPMNMFTSVREYPPGDFKGVVRVNFDTLYSIAWLDMNKEPMIVSAPNADDRYFLLPMLDMCGPMYLRHPVGVRPAHKLATSLLLRPTGVGLFQPE